MAYKMGMSRADLSGPKPVPAGIYELQVESFKPAVSKSGDSLNYNLKAVIANQPEFSTNHVFSSLNTKFFTAIRDFVHSCGVDTETMIDPEDGQEIQILPGIFEGQKENLEDPSKWGKYMGPLTNKVFKVELAVTEYNGKQRNEIRAYYCSYPGCAEEYPDLSHSQNLIKR